MINIKENDWINSYHKKILRKVEHNKKNLKNRHLPVWWKHIKNDKKKVSDELGSQPEWTSQTHDLRHEIRMTPKIAERKKILVNCFFF